MLLFLFVSALKIQIEQEDLIKRGLMFMGLKRVKIKLKSLQPTFICRCAGKYTDWSQTPAPKRDCVVEHVSGTKTLDWQPSLVSK